MRSNTLGQNYITFESRNNTARTIVAWRGNLQIINPFGDVILERELIFGEEADLPANGTNRSERWMQDRYETAGFDLEDYQPKDMKFLWTNLRVAY